jgi:pentatricopeptide repeat protein
MLACAKLGLWQRALEIYHYVAQHEIESAAAASAAAAAATTTASTVQTQPSNNGSKPNGSIRTKRKRVFVTDDMVLSLVKACVRASRLRASGSRRKNRTRNKTMNNATDEAEEYDDDIDVEIDCVLSSPEMEEREAALRRIPLDTALEILSTLSDDHNIELVGYMLNPLAAAYQKLGYIQLSRDILQSMLADRTAGEDEIFNVHDLCAKDKGSYSLLVQGAVVTGDWGSAVEALGDMTKAGLYPNPRHCNIWSEISERQTRPRAVGSWKKKRDDIWADSVR